MAVTIPAKQNDDQALDVVITEAGLTAQAARGTSERIKAAAAEAEVTLTNSSNRNMIEQLAGLISNFVAMLWDGATLFTAPTLSLGNRKASWTNVSEVELHGYVSSAVTVPAGRHFLAVRLNRSGTLGDDSWLAFGIGSADTTNMLVACVLSLGKIRVLHYTAGVQDAFSADQDIALPDNAIVLFYWDNGAGTAGYIDPLHVSHVIDTDVLHLPAAPDGASLFADLNSGAGAFVGTASATMLTNADLAEAGYAAPAGYSNVTG